MRRLEFDTMRLSASSSNFNAHRHSPHPRQRAAGQEASAAGRFFGLPWHGTFRFEMTVDGGYRGVMIRGPLRRMECHMVLRPVIGGTVIEHGETYEPPLLLRPLQSLIRRWLDKTLERARRDWGSSMPPPPARAPLSAYS